nr:kelch protein 18 [Hymenolepis microstoma]
MEAPLTHSRSANPIRLAASAIDFAYTGEIDINVDNVGQLYLLAHHLGSQSLIDVCRNFIKSRFEQINVNEIWMINSILGKYDLRDQCILKIAHDFDSFAKDQKCLRWTTVKEMETLLSSPWLWAPSEDTRLEAVMSWINAAPSTGERDIRDVFFTHLLSTLNVNKLSRSFIVEAARDCGCAVACNEYIYVIGGMTKEGECSANVFVVNPCNGKVKESKSMTQSRITPSAVTVGNEIFIFGGINTEVSPGSLYSCEKYSPLKNNIRLWCARDSPAYALLAFEDRNDHFVRCDVSPIHPALCNKDLSGFLDHNKECGCGKRNIMATCKDRHVRKDMSILLPRNLEIIYEGQKPMLYSTTPVETNDSSTSVHQSINQWHRIKGSERHLEIVDLHPDFFVTFPRLDIVQQNLYCKRTIVSLTIYTLQKTPDSPQDLESEASEIYKLINKRAQNHLHLTPTDPIEDVVLQRLQFGESHSSRAYSFDVLTSDIARENVETYLDGNEEANSGLEMALACASYAHYIETEVAPESAAIQARLGEGSHSWIEWPLVHQDRLIISRRALDVLESRLLAAQRRVIPPGYQAASEWRPLMAGDLFAGRAHVADRS